ncbi:leucine-rich repeat-containing protein 15-like [Anopheles nili]|uniref:leucine-rich repeat-containing protein 15-like n=1 Tax=Anopheles nili TaxID=185578 RepID=UPI00237C0551|nr:leucine-rich repeat-containing protein 15-like [Anopheles nili]
MGSFPVLGFSVLYALFLAHSIEGAVLRQYTCDSYFQSWCQLHNATVQMEADVQTTVFPAVRQLGFIFGKIGNFSHTFNNQLFRAGVLRVFARGTLVSRLTMPSTIEQLYLRDNDLRTVEIDPRARYVLRYLRLQMNKLRTIARFEHLTQLLELNLCDNLIEDVPLDTFATMPNLRQLVLCGNHIKTLGPTTASFVQLSALTHLDLGGNFLTQLPLDRWQLPELINLSVRDNLLTALDSSTIVRRFPRLRIFDASANALDCRSYHNALQTFANRSVVHLIDRRMCAVDDAIVLDAQGTHRSVGDGPTVPLEVRHLKERIFLQQRTIQVQRMEIEQLRANLTTLMEQFDLIADPARAHDPF